MKEYEYKYIEEFVGYYEHQYDAESRKIINSKIESYLNNLGREGWLVKKARKIFSNGEIIFVCFAMREINSHRKNKQKKETQSL